MLKYWLIAIFLSLGPVPAAAAEASDEARSLLALREMDRRVAAIGHRIALSSADICARIMPLTGMAVHTIEQYSPQLRDAAGEAFGLGAAPMILLVVEGSPADRAGLRPGDEIVSIAERGFPAPAASRKGSYARLQQLEEHVLARAAAGPVTMTLSRGGQPLSAALEPEKGCLSRVQLVPASRLNASADGTYAQLTTGIVGFAAGDDELAVIIAHEMAHNILGHRSALDRQGVSRGWLKMFDGSAAKIRATEIAADYLGLYLVARAGYDIGAAPGFWDRFGREAGPGIFSDGSHPGRSARIRASQATIAEIAAKRAAGQPLIPTLPAN